MDRAEGTGLGIAVAGHAALFAMLSIAMVAAPKLAAPPVPSVEVQLVDEVGVQATVPVPSPVEPAPSVAPELGAPSQPPPTSVADAPSPPEPTPAPRPAPSKPVEPSVAKPVSKPVPAKPTPPRAKPTAAKVTTAKSAATLPNPAATSSRPVKVAAATPARGSRLGANFLDGVGDRPSTSTATTPRAAAGPAVEASLAREVLRQLKPHWKSPTGADAEQLRSELSIRLSADGTVADVRVLRTKGVTDSNRGQVQLHNERAVRAVRLASPFELPRDLYETWKTLEPVGFDRRLSQ